MDRYWIGLNTISVATGFVWSDGTPVNYANWAKGEPNNANGGESCGEMLGSSSKLDLELISQIAIF